MFPALVTVLKIMVYHSPFMECSVGQVRFVRLSNAPVAEEKRPLISGQFVKFSNNGLNSTITNTKL
jgi:hypothetical protein